MGAHRSFFPAFIAAVLLFFALGACTATVSPPSPVPAGTAAEADWRARYDSFGNFHEGRAWVSKDGKEFHITPDGTPAYAERYDWVGDFHEGRAWVSKDGESFYIIDLNGTRIEE